MYTPSRGERPFLSKKYDIEKHPNYKFLADFDSKYTFDIEGYLSSRLKLRKDDVYVVAEVDMTKETA
jgi:type IV secretion system protein VirD4